MRTVSFAVRPARWLLSLAAALVVACTCLVVFDASAAAQPPSAPPDDAASLNTLIEPALLESLQQSIVGLVTVWEDPAGSPLPTQDARATPGSELPAFSLCTGWFDSPTTIATAGHCVDPKEGREIIDAQAPPEFDPATGLLVPAPAVRPEPKRTVYAFQPRELPGAVITTPVIVRVDGFRSAEDGDTAKLEVAGLPPAKPLAIASGTPRLGETVTSIGFPGLNIPSTDGVNVTALLSGGKTVAEVLQDSRLQPTNTSGTITARQFWQGVAAYQINADLAEGTSGGPTINSRGEVYGVNSQMVHPSLGQNFNIITDTGMLREFLGHDEPQGQPAADVPIRPTGGVTTSGTGELPTGWIVALSALTGAALGGVASWRLTRTRRRPSTDPVEETGI
ncbi:trypsin-like peptidase domain-containing protein [Pseudonocardia sp. TRM90224]|uniref:trypsin-like peptidase domain-containing protein n=1 Tax=Pseudonocardia sp. TRM90224 TaxID=2812678 RepID=UPI001E3716E2|nr:trypsin-like peptidase domain-containing protein [Pseudonocardia sp. TRM90224]